MEKRSKEELADAGELCKYCSYTEYGDIEIHTNPMNMCEGVKFSDAYDTYLESENE